MKKVLAVILAFCLLLTCTACGESGTEKMKIGVVQLVKHDALDAAYKGFVDGLAEAGYSTEKGNIEFDYQVATGKPDECATIANQLVSGGSDLILAIATPAAQAAVNATSTIPILVTAVTNPDGDCPGENVSGTSDLGPIERQIQFAKEICPSLKTIGILYNSSEQNSKFQAELAIKAAEKMGIAYQPFTVTAATELQTVVESMKNKVEACWIPTDNTCASNMPVISDAAKSANVLTICGESGMVKTGGLATCGAVDYYELGKQTAAMAVKILSGEKKVSELPIEFQSAGEDAEIVINTDVAANYNIPQSVLDKATKITTQVEE